MELKQKLPKSLETSSKDLEIVKPYWIARNVVCQFPHQRCSGHHGLKLPQVKQYLKRGHFKTFTEQNMKKYSPLDIERFFGNDNLNSNEDGEERELVQFIKWKSKTKNVSMLEGIQNDHDMSLKKYNSQSKVGKISKRYDSSRLQGEDNNQQPFKHSGYHQPYSNRYSNRYQNQYSNQYSNQYQNRYQNSNLNDEQKRMQNKRKADVSKIFPSLYPPHDVFNDRSPPQFSPLLSDRSIEQYQNEQSHLSANNKHSKLKHLGTSKLLHQQRFSSYQHTPIELQQNTTSIHNNLPQQDKAMLLQQLSQTIKILQATLNKKERVSVINSKKIMSLVASTQILRNTLKQQNINTNLEQYLSEDYVEVVKQIQKVLHKNVEYNQIVKELEEKFKARNVVVKKVIGTERQKTKNMRRSRVLEETEEEEGDLEGQQNAKKRLDYFKKHQRYKSDNVLLENLRKQQANLSRIEQQKDELMNKRRTKFTKNNSNSKLSKLKSGNKKLLHSKSKLTGLSKKSNTNKKSKQVASVRSTIIFDQQKLQKIQVGNKIKNRRPISTKANRTSFIQKMNSIKKYSSEKLILQNQKINKRTLRVSFIKLLKVEKAKAKSMKKSKAVSKGLSKDISKIDSSNTTPPPDLIQQIDDGNQSRTKSRMHIDSTHQTYKQSQYAKKQQRYQKNRELNYKAKTKAKLNRFQLNDFHQIDIPSPSQDEQDQQSQPQDTLRADRKRKSNAEQNPDWSQIIKGVPKKKTHKINIQKRNTRRKIRRMVVQLNSRHMTNLHNQVYRILDNRIPEFEQLRKVLISGQNKLKQIKIIQSQAPAQSQYIEQKWINGLDFIINIHTNHRQHVGSLKGPRILVRHDPDTDPSDLYEIACRQSHVNERLQEKERLLVFAKESAMLGNESQEFNKDIMSYAF